MVDSIISTLDGSEDLPGTNLLSGAGSTDGEKTCKHLDYSPGGNRSRRTLTV
jgi:hypothetical protein